MQASIVAFSLLHPYLLYLHPQSLFDKEEDLTDEEDKDENFVLERRCPPLIGPSASVILIGLSASVNRLHPRHAQ